MKRHGRRFAMLSAAGLPVALSLALSGYVAAGQNVYRCGPERNVYSQQPCSDGAPVDVHDPRSAAQRAAARSIAAQERKRADQLTSEREKESEKPLSKLATAVEPATRASSRAATSASQPASSARPTPRTGKRRSAASAPTKDFVAIVPASGPWRRQAASSPTP